MSWVAGQRYRFKAVGPTHAQIEKNPKTGTPSAQILAEVTLGPQLGQRLRWRGYLNTTANGQTAIAEMRVMGWKGTKLGDWAGLGSVEFEATVLSEVSPTDGKTYYRLAWPRALAKMKTENAVKGDELGELNATLGDLLQKADPASLPAAPTPTDAGGDEQIPF